jgi:3-oxo-5-alpha-steroid 4-dehydrogenase 1
MSWPTGEATYDTVFWAAMASAAVVALISVVLPSPYGRFGSKRFGVGLSPKLGWLLMELPATVAFTGFFLAGPRRGDLVPLIFLGVWLVHYGNRGFVFPLLIRVPKGVKGSFSLVTITVGWGVTTVHGYLHAAYFTSVGPHYTVDWLTDPRFLIGLPLYLVSLVLNIHSDAVLRNLRSKDEVAAGEKVYRIPKGGLFRWVTSPSYLTELTAWAGFAIFTWSPGGLFILAISLANLVPRARATHRWYRGRFADYPPGRKALVPFLF